MDYVFKTEGSLRIFSLQPCILKHNELYCARVSALPPIAKTVKQMVVFIFLLRVLQL